MKTREIQTRRARYRIFFQHLVLAVSLAFVTGQAGATHNSHHNPNGPRASLLSTTTCALNIDGANTALEVTNTLTNKSSGESTPEIRSWVISGYYKLHEEDVPDKKGHGNILNPLGDHDVCMDLGCPVNLPDLPAGPITVSFPLCALVVGGQFTARELNGKSVVGYGISGDDETPSVTNHCTADPVTGEGGGIKIDATTLAEIQEACSGGSGG